jgi:hypothetical protein
MLRLHLIIYLIDEIKHLASLFMNKYDQVINTIILLHQVPGSPIKDHDFGFAEKVSHSSGSDKPTGKAIGTLLLPEVAISI